MSVRGSFRWHAASVAGRRSRLRGAVPVLDRKGARVFVLDRSGARVKVGDPVIFTCPDCEVDERHLSGRLLGVELEWGPYVVVDSDRPINLYEGGQIVDETRLARIPGRWAAPGVVTPRPQGDWWMEALSGRGRLSISGLAA